MSQPRPWIPGGEGAAPDLLYRSLPAFLRRRDADGSLRALVAVMDRLRREFEVDIDRLYDGWFIETCPEWAVPYIADLLGVRGLPDVRAPDYSRRALVANTLRHRRRKGTAAMLGGLATDVTGWNALAVPFFDILGWTQNPNHLRMEDARDVEGRGPPGVRRVGTANLRDVEAMEMVGGAFDRTAHTADVRPLGTLHGWHNIRNAGVFLWRLKADPIGAFGAGANHAPARARLSECPAGFRLSPFGNDAPLFTRPAPGDEGSARQGHPQLAVPQAISPVAFRHDVAAWYGPGRSVEVMLPPGRAIPPEEVEVRDLSRWRRPTAEGRTMAIDPALGRITFAQGKGPEGGDPVVWVAYHQGLAAPIGGGGYERRGSAKPGGEDSVADPAAFGHPPTTVSGVSGSTVAGAIAAWDAVARPRMVFEIADSLTYGETLDFAMAGEVMVLQARAGSRPFLDGSIRVHGPGGSARLVLDGLAIAGPLFLQGEFGKVVLRHCTIIPGGALDGAGQAMAPGAPALVVEEGSAVGAVEVERCIVGPITAPDGVGIEVRDSILDAPRAAMPIPGDPRGAAAAIGPSGTATAGPDLDLDSVTVFGAVQCGRIDASDCIFTHPVMARTRQQGCIRFSHVPDGSRTPRRFQCQPDLAASGKDGEAARAERLRVAPAFTASDFGKPAYGQLGPTAAREIREGAHDGGEMGAHRFLAHTQRMAALRLQVDNAVPFGMQWGPIHVT